MLKEKKIFKKNIFVISIYFCSILHPKNKSELWSIEFAKLFRLRRSLFQFEKRFFEMKVTMVSSVMILKFLVVLNLSFKATSSFLGGSSSPADKIGVPPAPVPLGRDRMRKAPDLLSVRVVFNCSGKGGRAEVVGHIDTGAQGEEWSHVFWEFCHWNFLLLTGGLTAAP